MSASVARYDVEFVLPSDGSGGAGLAGKGSIDFSPGAIVLAGKRRGLFGVSRPAREEIALERIVDVRRAGPAIAFMATAPMGATEPPRAVVFRAASDDAAAAIAARLPQSRTVDVTPPHAEFAARLTGATPRAVVSPVLIGLCVAVFIATAAAGVDVGKPKAHELIPWGANFAPLTTDGQWWRLLTSTFLHFGLAHLALNMWALLSVGSLVERAYGNVFFLVLYLVSGLCGSAASLLWRQDVVSAGASGAVFGVYGALLAYLLVQKASLPKTLLTNLLVSTVTFVAFNIVNGLAAAGIDNAAHVGGLVGGGVMGAILARPLTEPRRGELFWPRLSTGVAFAALVLLPVPYVVPESARTYRQEQAFRTEFLRFLQEEKALQADAQRLFEQGRSRTIDDREMATRLEPIVKRWADAHARLATLALDGKAPSRERHQLLVKYVGSRRDEYATLAEALRTQDRQKLAAFKALRTQAEETLKVLNASTAKR